MMNISKAMVFGCMFMLWACGGTGSEVGPRRGSDTNDDESPDSTGSDSGPGIDLDPSGSDSTGGGQIDGCGRNLTGTVRDFSLVHPDFEAGVFESDKGIIEEVLGPDGKPVYAHGETGTVTTTGAEHFDQWFRDVDGVNQASELTLGFEMVAGTTNVFRYAKAGFFPIDGLLANESMLDLAGRPHNYHFTFELHTKFVYQGGEVFTFKGDDDVFTFINGKLAVDLGGVHEVQQQSVNLDEIAPGFGLLQGEEYALDFFFAERHTTESNFQIDTSIVFTDCGVVR
jgi:fibro-slime domain-containing protein